jgi:LysR family transcriptional regulator, glycine cleavage system transcriptional activator
MRALSRLKSLQAFEAAARHGSFIGAARELNVTPAAVGQLVRALEAWVGMALFLRRRSGSARLVPVEHARAALDDLAEGLDRLDRGLKRLRAPQTAKVVLVSASQAIMARWLVPGLPDFCERHPQIDIRLDVTDRIVDIAGGAADIGVRCGPGHWPGVAATRLMSEELVAVCSPRLIGSSGATPSSDWLSRQTFVNDTSVSAFPDWSAWLRRAGFGTSVVAKRLDINSSSAAIQAAIRGSGVALVRLGLTEQAIERGELRRLYPKISLPLAWAYYVVAAPASLRRPEVAAFHAWLIAHWRRRRTEPDASISRTRARSRRRV